MPSVVSDLCKKCYSCVEVCPVDAFAGDEISSMIVINPEVCIDCGICIPECPENAITSDAEAEQKWIDFNAEKAKNWEPVSK